MKTIAIDIGYGYTKACGNNHRKSSLLEKLSFPSVIGIAENIRYSGNLIDSNNRITTGIHLTTDQGPRFVGDLALRQARVHWSARDRQRTRDDTLTLALAALSELLPTTGGGWEGGIRLITGLPVQWYNKDRDALAGYLAGEHTIRRAGREDITVQIEPAVIIQPFGSVFYTLLNDDGKIINGQLAKGRIGVLDIGMYTTDFVILEGGDYIEPGSGSTTTAMGRVCELVSAGIEHQFDYQLDPHQTDRAIRRGKLTIRGHQHSLVDIVEPILQGIAADVLAAVATRWADYEAGLDTIIVSGGGAGTIGPYLADRFPHLAILPDGAMTNVIGYYRYGLMLQHNQARKANRLEAESRGNGHS